MFEKEAKEKAKQLIDLIFDYEQEGFSLQSCSLQIIDDIIIPTCDEPDAIYWEEVRDEVIKMLTPAPTHDDLGTA
jgi:hypothetical protein